MATIVIAAIPGDDLVASGDQARHPDGVLVGVGAAIGEEHLVEALGRAVEDQLGCPGPSLIGVRRSDGRQLLHLLDDAGDDLGVLVPEVGEDELAGEVEVALAVVVPDGAALTAGDGERGKRALGRPGVEDPGSVSGGDVWRSWLDHAVSRMRRTRAGLSRDEIHGWLDPGHPSA